MKCKKCGYESIDKMVDFMERVVYYGLILVFGVGIATIGGLFLTQ